MSSVTGGKLASRTKTLEARKITREIRLLLWCLEPERWVSEWSNATNSGGDGPLQHRGTHGGGCGARFITTGRIMMEDCNNGYDWILEVP